MRVYFTQIYPQAGVSFDISHKVTVELTHRLSKALARDQSLELKHGEGYELGFIISAMKGISEVEIKGPSISKRHKAVEYVLYLPHDRITRDQDHLKGVLCYLSQGVSSVLSGYNTSVNSIDALLLDLTREISESLDFKFEEEKIEIDFDEIINKIKGDHRR